MKALIFAKDENMRFFIAPANLSYDPSVTILNFILTCSSRALYNN